MDGILSVSLTAEIDQFTKNFNTVSKVAEATGQKVSVVASNMSKNISQVNRIDMSSFNNALSSGALSVTKFTKSTDQLLLDLSKLNQQFNKTTNPTTLVKLQSEIKKTESELRRLKSFSDTGVFDKLSSNSNRAGSAMTDFSRIVQDAPFGFIAIQNNINPMLESFGRLRVETGSTGGALKLMAGQLTGAGGLGLAIAAVTSAITAYTMYQQRAGKVVKDAKKDTEDYISTLDQLTQVKVKGSQDAQREIVELSTLYAAATNVSKSTQSRIKYVDELQSKYPEYFKNIKDETILNGGAKAAYDSLTTSIIATARARAAQDLIMKNSSRRLENEQKIIDLEKEQIKNNLSLAKAREEAGRTDVSPSTSFVGNAGSTDVLREVTNANNKILDTQRQINNLKTDSGLIDAKNLKLTESITEQINAGAKLTSDTSDKGSKKIKTLSDVLKDLTTDLSQVENRIGATFDDKQKGKISSYQKAIDELIKLGFNASSDAVVSLKGSLDKLFGEDQKKKAEEFFNFELPTRLAGQTAEKVKKESLEQQKALQDAINVSESLYQKLAAPSAFENMQKDAFVMNFGLSNSEKEIERIKGSIASLNTSFESGSVGFDSFKEKYKELSDELSKEELTMNLQALASDTLADGLFESFTNIGESIVSGGDIISAAGEGMKKAFVNLLSQLGQQFITMGAAKIAAGILATPFGGKLIADGTALVALGAGLSIGGGVLKGGSSSKGSERKPTAFANGGIISGPTYGLMGEYSGAKNNPEVVAPLSKLKGMIADTNSGGEINTRIDIEGEQLFIILERTKRRLDRSN